MLETGLALSIVVSALLTLRAASRSPRRWFYLFKPLTTGFILLAALTSPLVGWNPYAFWVAAGLAFSLAGDVFLMLSDKRFVWGPGCFLAAHVCYIVAFTLRSAGRESLWLSLPFIVAGLGVVIQIAPRARRLRWPVTVYTLVLAVMAWRACALAFFGGSPSAQLAGLGAILFMVSDTLLAINHFVRRFRGGHEAVLGTYYAAQAFIAWSVWPAWWPIL